MSTTAISPVVASTKVLQLLQRLHALSSEQEKAFSEKWTQEYFQKEEWPTVADEHMRDKFVALDADKCQFIYLLARSMGVCNAVEAGTSFGVSTMYLALAVGQNVRQKKRVSSTGQQQSSTLGLGGKVIATEKEESKAARARLYWKEAGEEIEPWIELREGDLLKTLKVEDDMPQEIDLLLLDSMLPAWPPPCPPVLSICNIY